MEDNLLHSGPKCLKCGSDDTEIWTEDIGKGEIELSLWCNECAYEVAYCVLPNNDWVPKEKQ